MLDSFQPLLAGNFLCKKLCSVSYKGLATLYYYLVLFKLYIYFFFFYGYKILNKYKN